MPLIPIIIVLVSAASHAYWNLLAKQARDKLAFAWLVFATGVVLLVPLAVYGGLAEPIHPRMWLCTLGTSLTFTAYAVLLARTYRLGEISLVYPVMRSAGPLLTVLVAALFLRERISLLGFLGIVSLVAGGTGVSWAGPAPTVASEAPVARRRQLAAVLLAAACGATIAVFSAIDKRGVSLASPMFYFFTTSLGATLCLGPIVLRRRSWEAVVREARVDWRLMWITSALNVFSYLLVLYALRLTTQVGYVVALRSTAVIFAIFLGHRVLGEGRGVQRLLFGVLIMAGLTLIAMQR
jgi:drug/metabolite transporter (DMT)-like permease